MLETLAGRLKWERTDGGIRVVIPVRLDWLAAMSGISLWIFPASAVSGLNYFMHFSRPVSVALNEIVFGLGVCLIILWFTMISTLKQVLTLSPAEMQIQARFFGIGAKKRTCATSRLHSLRFGPSGNGDFTSFSQMSRIEIDRDFKTRKLAFGITQREADALIEKMMEVYKFPKYPETSPARAEIVN